MRLFVMIAAVTAGAAAAEPPAPTAAPAPAPAVALARAPTSLIPEPGLPRTPDGRPDLQGVAWTANFFPVWTSSGPPGPLVIGESEARAMVKMMAAGFLGSADPGVRLDPEAEGLIGETDGLPLVRGERRTRLIVLPDDGRLPLTPKARTELSAYDWLALPSDHPEERPAGERCLATSPPIGATISLNPRQFIQTRDHIVLHTEYGDEGRIIPMEGAGPAQTLPSRLGRSSARWDGDTLVIETTGLPADDRLKIFPPLVLNPDATLIERFTRVSQDELVYQFTVIDPETYSQPWLAEYSLYRSPHRLYGWSCHEANYSLPNVLMAGRVADARRNGRPVR